jgi:hypothetical protein
MSAGGGNTIGGGGEAQVVAAAAGEGVAEPWDAVSGEGGGGGVGEGADFDLPDYLLPKDEQLRRAVRALPKLPTAAAAD